MVIMPGIVQTKKEALILEDIIIVKKGIEVVLEVFTAIIEEDIGLQDLQVEGVLEEVENIEKKVIVENIEIKVEVEVEIEVEVKIEVEIKIEVGVEVLIIGDQEVKIVEMK